MRESDLLSHIYKRTEDLRAAFPQVIEGPGDDCAVIRTPSGDQMLLTVDHLVEGRHFEALDLVNKRWMLDLIARKAVARSISDIAAMGGSPTAALATACLPPGFPQDAANELFDAMDRWAKHWSCPLVGGDIAVTSPEKPGPLVLTVTATGLPHPTRGPVRRSGARAYRQPHSFPGDAIWVTGRLGGSLRLRRHLTFEPRLGVAKWLCDTHPQSPEWPILSAMIDLSDGLGRDAARVGDASKKRLVIDAALIPLNDGVTDWRQAVSDGEDYELLFTLDADGTLPPECPETGTKFTRIGYVWPVGPGIGETPEPRREGNDALHWSGCVIRTPEGRLLNGREMGWDHTD
jgi:thiamine-monophosphate kinase